MNTKLASALAGLMLLSNFAYAARIPDFVKSDEGNIAQESYLSQSNTRLKYIPNDAKWTYAFTGDDNKDYWINEGSIVPLHGETEKVKFTYCVIDKFYLKDFAYGIYKAEINYTDEYFMQLTAAVHDSASADILYNSMESQSFRFSIGWFDKLLKKQPFSKSPLGTQFAELLKPYLSKTISTSSTQHNQPNNSLVQTSAVIPGNAYIPARTKIKVALLDRLDSKKSVKNQIVEFKTIENLIINGVVVIPEGTIGRGQIYDIQKPGGFGRKGVLRMRAKEIKTLNNVSVPLIGELSGQGKTDGGAVAVFAAVSMLGGALMKGSGIAFEPGTNFTVEIKHDTDLGVPLNGLKEAMNPSVPRGVEIILPTK